MELSKANVSLLVMVITFALNHWTYRAEVEQMWESGTSEIASDRTPGGMEEAG